MKNIRAVVNCWYYCYLLAACLGLSSFVQGAGSTYKRTTSQTTHDITSYGAQCDGSNDAAAVNAAIAAAGTSGTVIVPCMATIGGPGVVIRNKSNFRMTGENGGGFRTYTTDGDWDFDGSPIVLAIQGCESCTIEGLTFEGNDLSVSLLRMVQSTNSIIQHNTFYDAGMGQHPAVIGAYGGSDNKFYYNSIYRAAFDVAALWIGNPGGDLETNPDIQYNYANDTQRTAIVTTATGLATVSNNNAHNVHVQGNGMKLTGNDVQVVCEHNVMTNNEWSGITFVGQNMNVIARYNHVENNRHVGFGIDTAVSGEISYNTIVNNYDNAEQAGIFVNGANNLMIHNNIISGVGSGDRQQLGIYVYPIMGNDVTSLTIANNSIDNNENDGIYINEENEGAVNSVNIIGNSFTNNPRNAIWVQYVSGSVTASNNCFYSNGVNILDDTNVLSNPSSADSMCESPVVLPTTPSDQNTPSSFNPTSGPSTPNGGPASPSSPSNSPMKTSAAWSLIPTGLSFILAWL